jgi:hypothetical protein
MSALRDEMGIDEVLAKLEALSSMVERLAATPQPAFYTVNQVAEMENCSPRTISRRIASGDLPVTRRGSKPMIAAADINPIDPQFRKR